MTVLSARKPLLRKRVLLAVSGSVAACRADRIVRELQRRGAEVQVLLTEDGARFFPPETAGSFTELPVITRMFDPDRPGDMVHVDVKRSTDCVLVAPATANRLLQIEHPRADDALGTVLRAYRGPVMYAPAMNPDMWEQPRIQRIVRDHAEAMITPEVDEVACGDVGPGHLRSPDRIAEAVVRKLWPSPLGDSSWVVSGGPTREPWDRVRVLTNRSSGRMGEALALTAHRLGGSVSLVTGARESHYSPASYDVTRVETTRDMLEAVDRLMDDRRGYVGAAAVSDYRPRTREGKVPSGQSELSIPLEKNPDILKHLRSEYPRSVLVGFSADAESGPDRAMEKAREKDLQAVVFNPIDGGSGGFESAENRIFFCVPPGDCRALGTRTKLDCSLQVWLAS